MRLDGLQGADRNCGDMPKLSVIMPVYNGERYLWQAIESILNQTFRDFELLIINDGSTDRSREIAVSYTDPRIVLIDNERNMGLSRSLNRGICLARGEYVARQDADDLSHPDRLRRQVEYLERHPDIVLVGTRVQWIDPQGHPLRLSSPAFTCSQIRWGYLVRAEGISGAVGMFRKRLVVDQIGLYSEDFRYANDAELHSRIARRFQVANLPEPLYQVRVHSQQMTHTYGDTPDTESDQIVLHNMLDILKSGCADQAPSDWERHAVDLVALRALHTQAPAHGHKLTSAKSRQLLLTLLQSFRNVYELQGKEWQEFSAWLSREWLVAANVHLPERPHFAVWRWWAAIQLRWPHIFHPSSLRLLTKLAAYPAYVRLKGQLSQKSKPLNPNIGTG